MKSGPGPSGVVQPIPADLAPPDPGSESRMSNPGVAAGLFLGRTDLWGTGKRNLRPLQDRDSGFFTRDSGGAMSAGIGCTIIQTSLNCQIFVPSQEYPDSSFSSIWANLPVLLPTTLPTRRVHNLLRFRKYTYGSSALLNKYQ